MASFRNLTQWSNNFTKNDHVQPTETDGGAGNFLSGESAVIVAGPEKLVTTTTDSNMDKLIPIGLVQQAQLSQNKQINQILEIGSSVPIFIPGRVSVNATLSKILFDGPSLAYALYRSGKADTGDIMVPSEKQSDDPYSIPASPYPSDGKVKVDSDTPGLFWINLASRMFNKPLGIGFMLYDMEGQAYGGAYLEGCYLRAHNFGISANASVLAENVSLVAQRIRPVKASVMGDASDFYSRTKDDTGTGTDPDA
jgi:hypothetical protein